MRTSRGTALVAEDEEDPRRSDGEGMIPPASLDPTGEVAVSGEGGSKETQEGEGGRAAAKAAAADSEGVQKLSTQ